MALVGLALPAPGQSPAFPDPANLTVEKVRAQAFAEALPQDEGAVALAQMLKKLNTRASLMMIVAHPDDEDGGMLTYESRGQGARVAMLTLNRGEGGQNLMSADFDGALGVVRTEELLAADRYMGVDQMFGTVVDFGFSKTREEALAKWGHDRVLYDAVRAVRLYRPLVVASVFVGGVTDGHGHHQVSGEMAQEVFEAAGDPKVFPDQIAQGLQPWTPLKVYARVPFAKVTKDGMYDYATNKYLPTRFYNYVTKTWSTEVPKANVVVPEGEYSKLLGMSYVQFARKGLALQKTQIGSGVRLAPAGKYDVGYTRYGSRVPAPEQETGFFDGVDVTLAGIAALAPDAGFLPAEMARIQGLVTEATGAFSMEAPERSAPALAEGLKAVNALIAKVAASGIGAREKTDVLHELEVKRVQFNDALVAALGLRMTADAEATVVPGQTLSVRLKAVGGTAEAREKAVVEGGTVTTVFGPSFVGKKIEKAGSGVLGAGVEQTIEVPVPAATEATRPYFRRAGLEQAYYEVANPVLRDAAVTPYPFVAAIHLRYDGAPVEVKMAAGDRHPAMVVPAVSVGLSPEVTMVPLGEKTLTVTATVRNDQKAAAQGRVRLELPAGWKAMPESGAFTLKQQGAEAQVAFTVAPAGLAAGREYELAAVAEVGGKQYREGFREVGYPGLTPTNFYREATGRVVAGDVKVAPGLKVAYLPGTGDAVVVSLEQMGVKATTVTVADVAAGRLAGFDAVVLGGRAYAAHPELANAKLLEYAAAGGVVIVQYNTGEMPAGPYPMSLGNSEKVVEEGARVELLAARTEVGAQALSWPNRIAPQDFDGWVEERGHGFMGTWDPRYEALTEVHDPGQDPQRGGLLVARTGKGTYVYVAYALYRQLPEGVPGAYRLFANLLSLGRRP
ncbi:MAG TPA: PIG-L family deacetylase [Granulicella sp.]|nr:PIG-L family deacetylase [Granulicella sp.]